MTQGLILIGGGGHCKACIDVIEQCEHYNIIGIVDKLENVGKQVLGYTIIGTDELLDTLIKEGYQFLICIGQLRSSELRQQLFNTLQKSQASFATVISPRAYVSRHAVVGEGSIIMHDVVINAAARIGKNCIINTKALVEHDAIVDNHCHISTAAVINGGVHIKQGTFFGSSAVSKEYVETSKNAFIKAGSLFKG